MTWTDIGCDRRSRSTMTYACSTPEKPTIISCCKMIGVAMKIRFNNFPTVFTKLRGNKGKQREYCALVSPSAEFCVIPQADAYYLGCTMEFPARPESSKMLTTYSGYINAAVFVMREVRLGNLTFENVEFIAHDLPQETRFDVVLGRTLFEKATVEIDYKSKTLKIEA